MEGYVQKFEKLITLLLVMMMAIVIALSLGDLAWLLLKDIVSPPILILDVDELLDLLGLFLLIMVAIELFETLRTYLQKKEIHTEMIILVALVALARKIVVLDVKAVQDDSLIGIAAMIIALAIAYYAIRRTHDQARVEHSKSTTSREEKEEV